MKTTLLALAAAAIVAVGTVTTPSPAEARNRGGAVAAGVIGGLAAGAIIGGALAQPRYYNPGYSYGYYGGAGYYDDAGPPCRIVRERFWDGFAWRIRRTEVCY